MKTWRTTATATPNWSRDNISVHLIQSIAMQNLLNSNTQTRQAQVTEMRDWRKANLRQARQISIKVSNSLSKTSTTLKITQIWLRRISTQHIRAKCNLHKLPMVRFNSNSEILRQVTILAHRERRISTATQCKGFNNATESSISNFPMFSHCPARL